MVRFNSNPFWIELNSNQTRIELRTSNFFTSPSRNAARFSFSLFPSFYSFLYYYFLSFGQCKGERNARWQQIMNPQISPSKFDPGFDLLLCINGKRFVLCFKQTYILKGEFHVYPSKTAKLCIFPSKFYNYTFLSLTFKRSQIYRVIVFYIRTHFKFINNPFYPLTIKACFVGHLDRSEARWDSS